MMPSLAVISIDRPQWSSGLRRLLIPAPLFLLWIPAIVLAPLGLVALAIGCAVGHIRFGRAVGALWALLFGLCGTDVLVQAEDMRVKIRIM